MLRIFVDQTDAWELLRRAVKQTWGLDELPAVTRLPNGKPVFEGHPDLHFNLSHSGDMALCALSDRPVGAEIEVIRPHRDGLPAYVFKGEEYGRYLDLGGDWPAFCVLWTEKESIVKYTGEGLKQLKTAQVPSGCVMTHLSGDGWRAAVCGHERGEKE